MTANIYEQHLDAHQANYAALSPLSLLARAADVYPGKISLIHGSKRFTWEQTYARSRRLASALSKRGIGTGDTVAIMGANTPEMYEAAFGVPMTGAVLNTLNVRLDAAAIAFCLGHGEARVLLTDREFSKTVRAALDEYGDDTLLVIDIDDSEAEIDGELLGLTDYESFLGEGDPDYQWQLPDDEWNAISLNYTSGTTGNPKGVVYHHRGAYLNALSNIIGWNMGHHPVYLWTLPMFHCNGWCFPWTLAAVAGSSVCLRQVNAANMYSAIAEHGVTHFCGAPIVLNFIANATEDERRPLPHTVKAMTAAAPPPASTLQRMQEIGFDVTHVYGLTETYGPAVMCAWDPDWDDLEIEEQTRLKGRQGVRYHVLEGLDVINPDTMEPVPRDGETMGEIMFRGNIVMKGYLKNPDASDEAFAGGWFHSGDLAVMQPDGYIKIQDRSKDVIISGGENISSIEVEDTLYKHPAVLVCAVVAKPDEKWGETPCAFIELKEGAEQVSEADVIAFCRDNLAHYKCPKSVIFCDIPKTSTGKIQKFKLRKQLDEGQT
ncbi:MAG: acyl-CoA synthetase [Rhodospirillaceae bacterium]|jgi:fatty-acyl-CoA synthase|nr:acyl-CoA synthetase [Rhodospirillaceae bacterium]MBT5245588.1 acyl-CoA synthetase [Rhodospirillaceae bacterium]MBT5561164.1 acyl-CoA synthetase [Rhodospirillaceae bacterium]MBT6242858.1 acyl-CoA synthetase [Rhodospirillaceae bacterium]MBT7136333.1 acyl-CoA synthetase [Rhodospirillaceae bacterium]